MHKFMFHNQINKFCYISLDTTIKLINPAWETNLFMILHLYHLCTIKLRYLYELKKINCSQPKSVYTS